MSQKEYFKKKEQFAEQCIELLKKKTGIDISDCIEEMSVATPWTFARYMGNAEGNVYGYDDMEKLIIKCPACGQVMSIDDNPAFVGRVVTCPVCKTKRKFEEYKRSEPSVMVQTVSDETVVVNDINNHTGALLDLSSGKK